MTCKILFSSHHIKHPLTIHPSKCDSKKANLDIRIQAIFISVLAFILTAGIGGIVCFYCLTAKHKVKVLEEIKRKDLPPHPSRPTPSTCPPIHSFIPAPSPTTETQQEKSIREFISTFLAPYFERRITQETEAPDRAPLITLLRTEFPEFDLDRDELKRKVVEIYVREVTIGFHNNITRLGGVKCPTRGDNKVFIFEDRYAQLLKALTDSIYKEFPDSGITKTEIEKQIKQALVALLENLTKKEITTTEWR